MAVEALGFAHVAGAAGDGPGEEQDLGIVSGHLAGAGDVGAGAGDVVLAKRQRRRQVPGHRVARDELKRLVEILAGRGGIALGDQRSGAVEMDLAAKLGAQILARQRRIQGLKRARGVASGKPGIAGLDPEVGGAAVIDPLRLLGRLLVDRRGVGPLLERGISEADALAREQPAAGRLPAVGDLKRLLRASANRRLAGRCPAFLSLRHRRGRSDLGCGSESECGEDHLGFQQLRQSGGQQCEVLRARQPMVAVLDEDRLHVG